MDRQTVTVFGGSGFLGSEVVGRLVEAGFFVRVAARRPERLAIGGKGERWETVVCDVTEEQSVASAVAGARAVVNAVSLYVEKAALSFDAVHVEGAARVARCAREAGVTTLVHVSGIGTSTSSPSRYVRARARGDRAVAEAFPGTIFLRPSAMCAPGKGLLASLDAVTRLPVVPLFGRGTMRLQPVSVGDVAHAIAVILSQREAGREQVFELGGNEVYRYRELLELVMKHHGRRRLLLPLPMSLWHGLAMLLSVLPEPPLTRDQLYLIQEDNVVAAGAAGFADLGIEPDSVRTMLR